MNKIKPPFKTEGVYARKMNPEKEFQNYKFTRLQKIRDVALGKREEHCYSVLWFKGEYDSIFETDTVAKNYFAGYLTSFGEIFDIADDHVSRSKLWASHDNIEYDENSFNFYDDDFTYTGSFRDDLLILIITNKENGKSVAERLRFIPME